MNEKPQLDAVVDELVAEGQLRAEELRPEEREFLKEHALKKPLRVLDIWALGVGVVITGAYFGWNLGLKDNNGPVALLIASLLVPSLITAGFVIAGRWYKDAIDVAVLVSTLTALIWYILAIGCLFVLRRPEPQLFHKYRTPLYRLLPITVVVLSVFAVVMYGVINVQVIPLTLVLYAVGLGYFGLIARSRLQSAAPEELAARQAQAHPAEKPS
jgi:amino acid transporter